MRNVNLREAKASLSALVDAAEHGESVTITRHGKPAAVLISLDDAQKLNKKRRNFVEFLATIPAEGIVFERNKSTGRKIEFE